MARKKARAVSPDTRHDIFCTNNHESAASTSGKVKSGTKEIPLLAVSLRRERGTQSSGKPRFDKWEKLLHRFYEPLVLLYTLDPTRGAHLQRPTLDSSRSSQLRNGELRRTLLDKLSYICDFDNGGTTVTAIGLERRPDTIIYRLAANNNVRPKVRIFLESILSQLSNRSGLTPEASMQLQQSIANQCVDFSKERIKTYLKFLQRHLLQCRQALMDFGNKEELKAANDLLQFCAPGESLQSLCRRAYEYRKSKGFDLLNARIRAVTGTSEEADLDHNVFAQTRHYIGRLGSHISCAKILVDSAKQLPSLFDDFEVELVPCQDRSPAPPGLDPKVTLNGILNRMLPRGDKDPDSKELKAALEYMNVQHNIEKRVRDQYDSKNFEPQVHVELTLLEYFHDNDLAFLDGDRYIGCSKPACYCCWLYIRAHPGRFAEPACHNKIYLNWKAPSSFQDKPVFDENSVKHSKDIINEMVKTVRADAKAQIMARSPRRRSHPDSTTDITASMARTSIREVLDVLEVCSQVPNSAGSQAASSVRDDGSFEDDPLCMSGIGDGNEDVENSDDSDDGGCAVPFEDVA